MATSDARRTGEARIGARLDVASQAAWFAEHPFDAARANATRVALPEKLATLYEAIVEPLARAGIAGARTTLRLVNSQGAWQFAFAASDESVKTRSGKSL